MAFISFLSIFLATASLPFTTARPIFQFPDATYARIQMHNDCLAADAANLTRRSKQDKMAAAIAGITIAIGVVMLLLLFGILYFYRQKLMNLARPGRPFKPSRRRTVATSQLYRERAGKRKARRKRPAKEMDARSGRSALLQSKPAKAHRGWLGQLFGSSDDSSSTSSRSSVVGPVVGSHLSEYSAFAGPVTDMRYPETVEMHPDLYDPPDMSFHPPVVLPKLDTHRPTELAGSDEAISRSSSMRPLPVWPYEPYRWSMSTLGRNPMQETMDQPDPYQYTPSPETPGDHRRTSPSRVSGDFTAPVFPQGYWGGLETIAEQSTPGSVPSGLYRG